MIMLSITCPANNIISQTVTLQNLNICKDNYYPSEPSLLSLCMQVNVCRGSAIPVISLVVSEELLDYYYKFIAVVVLVIKSREFSSSLPAPPCSVNEGEGGKGTMDIEICVILVWLQ